MVQNSTIDWDNVRLFLELTRRGSARGAAQALNLSHSTVVRRVERLEADFGTRLFDRDFTGYRPTAAGETLLESAVRAEEAILSADRQLFGQDTSLSGEIALTLPDMIAKHFLMPELVTFSERYPDIDLKILISYDVFDLARREADVALRIYVKNRTPPDNLIGRNLVTMSTCCYATEEYLEKHDPWSPKSTARWIGWDDDERFPDWVVESPFPNAPRIGRLNNVTLQATAASCGLGMAILPCIVGDITSDLIRIPGCEPYAKYDVWMLSHPDLRDAARHRAFRELLVEVFDNNRDRLLGNVKREA